MGGKVTSILSKKLQSRLSSIYKGHSCIIQLLLSTFMEDIGGSIILRSSFSSCASPPRQPHLCNSSGSQVWPLALSCTKPPTFRTEAAEGLKTYYLLILRGKTDTRSLCLPNSPRFSLKMCFWQELKFFFCISSSSSRANFQLSLEILPLIYKRHASF